MNERMGPSRGQRVAAGALRLWRNVHGHTLTTALDVWIDPNDVRSR